MEKNLSVPSIDLTLRLVTQIVDNLQIDSDGSTQIISSCKQHTGSWLTEKQGKRRNEACRQKIVPLNKAPGRLQAARPQQIPISTQTHFLRVPPRYPNFLSSSFLPHSVPWRAPKAVSSNVHGTLVGLDRLQRATGREKQVLWGNLLFTLAATLPCGVRSRSS